MTMKERFTDEEWELLLGMPAQLVVGVAEVDETGLDQTEMVEAAKRLALAADHDPDPLYKELSRDLAASGNSLREDISHADPKRCRQVLQDKLSADEYQHFLKSVWVDGIAVARSSGGKKHVFRKDEPPVSDEEAQLLSGWAMFYGLDPTTAL